MRIGKLHILWNPTSWDGHIVDDSLALTPHQIDALVSAICDVGGRVGLGFQKPGSDGRMASY
jgi:hypothetical protein